MSKSSILMALEGTYPFHGGGVSTWAHILCNKINKFNFKIYSVNAFYETKPKYVLNESVLGVVQVPIWYALEPKEVIRFDDTYYDFIIKKEFLFIEDLETKFIPLFKRLLKCIYSEHIDADELIEVFIGMWYFFQENDYKLVFKDESIWNVFKKEIITYTEYYGIKEISLLDLTYAMRWIYHFLLPISIDFPKTDIIHLTISSFIVLPAIIQKYLYGTPILLTEHGVYIRERILAISQSDSSYFLKDFLIRLSECSARASYHQSDIIMSVNKFNFKWELMYGAEESKLRVVYNGIDHLRFKPLEKPKEFEGIPTVVAMARIFELKDILTMIRSCRVVADVLPNVQYRIHGENDAVPEYTSKCLKLIEELGLQENFFFLGPNPKPEVVFCEGDISILTSISEGFPYTIIESMSCGIPVVSTDVGGVAEALNEECGILCKPKDPEDIGRAVIKLLQDHTLRGKMKIACRKRVEEFFTIDKFIDQYEEIYEELLEMRK
ncbi:MULTISPECIES: GT4 family glycosyltransferase PelF [Flavobacterium]|nr:MULTISPECIES: GT4 family glycosyltransferase PelF [Flavobacterium]MCJ1807458.1 GT4 family glycosyltransferase PelF [Flavobacterium covae]MCJ1808685.1 GT4 family glycosyltransferase PelF [Flavobacterium covae]